MDLFGLKAHEEHHLEMARVMRRLVEQVSQLSINLSQTRVEVRELGLRLEGKVDMDDVDPTIIGINQALSDARVKLAEVAEAAEENWNALSEQLEEAVAEVDEKSSSLSEDGGDNLPKEHN
ncbi:MAG: hypothetical protein ACR2QK_02450 [Acidimicrobiales bacterium]